MSLLSVDPLNLLTQKNSRQGRRPSLWKAITRCLKSRWTPMAVFLLIEVLRRLCQSRAPTWADWLGQLSQFLVHQ